LAFSVANFGSTLTTRYNIPFKSQSLLSYRSALLPDEDKQKRKETQEKQHLYGVEHI